MSNQELKEHISHLKQVEENAIFMLAAISGAENNLYIFPKIIRNKIEQLLDKLLEDTQKHAMILDQIIEYLSTDTDTNG